MDQAKNFELKQAFAANLLRFEDPFKAAFATCGADTALALQIGRDWKNDPVVAAETEKLLSSVDAKSFLPTKEAQARDIYAIATNPQIVTEDRLKAHRLYAEIMGFIEKPTAGTTNNILNQGVMIVKDHGTDADWERKAEAQQRTLIGNASVN